MSAASFARMLVPCALACTKQPSPTLDPPRASPASASALPAAAPPSSANGAARPPTRHEPDAPRRAIAAVALSTRHGCAIDTQGDVLCWGTNTFGQVGPSAAAGAPGTSATTASREPLLPRRVELPAKATRLALSPRLSCALLRTNEVHCWGNTDSAPRSEQSAGAAFHVAGLPPVQDVSLGQHHACALAADGHVWCWGDNRFGQLGLGTRSVPSDPPRRPLLGRSADTPLARALPTPVPGVADAQSVVSTERASCALLRTGTTVCWGDGFECAGPVAMPELGPATALSAAQGAVCALRQGDGAVLRVAALDTSTERADNCHAYVPRALPATLRGASFVSCSHTAGCAVLSDGSLGCFELGGGSELDAWLTQATLARPAATAIALSSDSACLITPLQRLLCWGDNSFGQLGLSRREARAEPTEPELPARPSTDPDQPAVPRQRP